MALVTVNSNSTSSFRRGRQESVIQCDAGLVRLRVDEFTAHPVPGGQIADRLRSRQRLNGQLLTVTFRQPRRRANTPVRARTHLKTSRWHHPPWHRQPGFACNPALNHAGIGIGAGVVWFNEPAPTVQTQTAVTNCAPAPQPAGEAYSCLFWTKLPPAPQPDGATGQHSQSKGR